MSFIYITGIAGSGKTTIQKELRQRGLDVYDEDEPGIGAAHNKQTNEAVPVPPANERTPEWFKQHEWRVLAKAMAELKDRAKDHLVILCGNSANEKTARQLFDKVIYLKIDEATLRHRLAARADNDYGKTDQELQSILEQHKLMEQRYNASDPIIIDATQPISKVIQGILAVLDPNFLDHEDSSSD